MKKSFFTLGLAAVCALALTGCQKEIEPAAADTTVSEAIPFEIQAGFDATKLPTPPTPHIKTFFFFSFFIVFLSVNSPDYLLTFYVIDRIVFLVNNSVRALLIAS